MERVATAPVPSGRIRFDQFVLDPADERLIGPQGPIRIGNKAFRVLQALTANEGRLLTKDALFEDVWDGTHVSESALTSVIKELRRALGDDSRKPRLIESVYGRGYRLISEVAPFVEPPPAVDIGRQPAEYGNRNDLAMPVPDRTSLGAKPSIAVVPLIELGQSSEDWFAEAIAEEIIVALAHFRELFVISSTTSLNPRNRNRDVREVSEELGVRYVMHGTIQRSADRVRIIARLEDGIDNRVVWSDKFDEKLDDIFEMQDRIAMGVAARIGFSINDAEAHRAKYRPSMSLRDLFWQANLLIRRIEPSSIAGALALAERALDIEPEDPWAASIAAVASAFQFLNGWTSDRPAARQRAIAYCEQALRNHTEEDDDRVLGFCGLALASTGHDIDLASKLTDRAIELNPSNATSLFWGSWIDVTIGNSARAMERADASLMLNPMSGIRHLVAIPQAVAMIQQGHYAQAAESLRRVVAISPQGDALAALTIALVQLGEMDEARAVHARLKAAGGAIGGLALMRNPDHARLVSESLAAAAAA